VERTGRNRESQEKEIKEEEVYGQRRREEIIKAREKVSKRCRNLKKHKVLNRWQLTCARHAFESHHLPLLALRLYAFIPYNKDLSLDATSKESSNSC
jgi:hypothetical protein